MSDHTTSHITDHRDPPASNILLVTPTAADTVAATCVDLLAGGSPADVNVLFVTVTTSPSDRLQLWRAHAAGPPAQVGIVSVTDQYRSAASAGAETRLGDGGATVRTVSDPGDLTGIGIAINEYLAAWADGGNRTVICFESLTALLQYADEGRVFRFLNELTSQLTRAGAVAHFHITPGSHDQQTIDTLSSLFDDVRHLDDAATRAAGGASDAVSPFSGEAAACETDTEAIDESRFVVPAAESPDPAARTTAADGTGGPAMDSMAADESSSSNSAAAVDASDSAEQPATESSASTAPAGAPQPAGESAVTAVEEPAPVPSTADSGDDAPSADVREPRMTEATAFQSLDWPSIADRLSRWRVAIGVVSAVVVLVVFASLLGGVPIDDGNPGGGGPGGVRSDDAAAYAPATTNSTATQTATVTATQTSTATPPSTSSPSPTPTASPFPTSTPESNGGTRDSDGQLSENTDTAQPRTPAPNPTSTAVPAAPTATPVATPRATDVDSPTDSTSTDDGGLLGGGDGILGGGGLL